MQHIRDRLILSATDLSHFLACGHLSLLDRRAATGEGPKPPQYDDPALEVLWKRGLDHERRQLERFRQEGRSIIEIAELDRSLPYEERWQKHTAATSDAMRTGADVIYQGALHDGPWVGRADFLIRSETPSRLGAWSYEVMDTKLAREAKGGALLQVLLYADLLEQIQGIAPEHVHIALGGREPRTECFRVAEYAAYFRSVKARFLATMQAAPSLPAAAEPVEHCQICAWSGTCADDRRNVDHLSLVAGITLHQRRALHDAGVHTLEALATHAPDASHTLDGVSAAAFNRIHAQAGIQLEGRRTNANRHELIEPVTPDHGLAALPTPSAGDLFFDIEGDPFALDDGLEYLFGFTGRAGDYTGWWALDRAAERRTFEEFIDFVMRRLEQHPDLHIYHYNHYETTALKRLMGRYGTREREVDTLLRGGVFVDLYRVVRQGLRASVESYSIKKLEPFYGYRRDVDLREASRALAHFEAWLELGGEQDDELFRRIQGYNRDDCISTLRLHDWLERLRVELAQQTGAEVPRAGPPADDRREESVERDAVIDDLVARLTAGVPDDPGDRTPEQHGSWLNAQLIEFHRREKKAFWWEYFHRCKLTEDELVEDDSTLGRIEFVRAVEQVKRSMIYEYRFPP
ncbi:MAG TPA: TM0106 family RecB-like putative nuclease, partial [Longimicrobiales bacterium]